MSSRFFERRPAAENARILKEEAEKAEKALINQQIENIQKELQTSKKISEQRHQVLIDAMTEQNKVTEGLISQAQNNIDKIRQLEERNKNLQDFKNQVCDSGVVDCSNPNLELEPCMNGFCESSNHSDEGL